MVVSALRPLVVVLLALPTDHIFACGLVVQRSPQRRREQQKSLNAAVKEELLEAEVALYRRGENPITTLTWFRTRGTDDYKRAGQILENRLQKIIEQNPWLAGKVGEERRGKVYLNYDDDTSKLRARDFLTILDDPSTSPISRRTRLNELARSCSAYVLTKSDKSELLRVAVLPCRTNPQTHFALVVSMSHLVLDGNSYYYIMSMLCSKDDNTIVPLIVNRVRNTGELQAAAMGQENYDVFGNTGLSVLLNLGMGYLRSQTFGPANQGVYALVDAERMEQAKKDAADESDVDFVSTNDVLTSWFMQNVNSKAAGAMAINWRNRLPGHTELHAGNYENIILYAKADSASPSLIRKSLVAYRRTETINDPAPSFFQAATTPFALVTNWASFSKPNVIEGCQEELHIPLYDPIPLLPTDSAIMIIFRAGPQKGLGLYVASSPDNLRRLGYGRQFSKRAPFLSTKSLR